MFSAHEVQVPAITGCLMIDLLVSVVALCVLIFSNNFLEILHSYPQNLNLSFIPLAESELCDDPVLEEVQLGDKEKITYHHIFDQIPRC